MAYLEIKKVSKTYNTKQGPYVALHDVNLNVGRGEFISLIGHSGCGKSTLLNMVAGLEHPTNGTIHLDGKIIEEPGPDRSVVFQNYSLLPWLSVWENVYEAIDLRRVKAEFSMKEAVVEEYLAMVGLCEHRNKKPQQLSGGMKQRAAIARAFAVNPEVLLLDEPFAALDSLTRANLQDELVNLWRQERTMTVFMVTHDIEEAIYLSDKIAVFSRGPSATIENVVEVDIPRPRDRVTMLEMDGYFALKKRLLGMLTASSPKHEISIAPSISISHKKRLWFL